MEDARQRTGTRAAEAISLALACASPWAFGSVEAWAELAIELGIVALAFTAAVAARGSGRSACLLRMPGLALAGLLVLALIQAAALPDGLLRRLAPAASDARASYAPGLPESVRGDAGPAVPPPSPTISRDPDATLHAAARIAAAWVLFQSVLGLSGGHAALRRLGRALAANATLLALFSLVQALTWDGKIFWFRPSPVGSGWGSGGPFVGHGPLAACLNLGLGFTLASLLRPGGGGHGRAWPAYATVVIAVGVVASQSRIGFLAMSAAAVMVALASRPGSLRPIAAVAGLLAMACLVLPALGESSPLRRLGSLADSSALVGRTEIWRASAVAWWRDPVWGSGLGTFATATAPHVVVDRGTFHTRAEDEYLDILAEGGVIGLGLVFIGMTSVARLGRRALRAAPTALERAPVLGALFGMASLAVHSLGDFAPHLAGVWVPAVILCARLCRVGIDAEADPTRRAGRSATGRVAIVLVGLGVLPLGIRLARAEAALAGTDIPLPGTSSPMLEDDGASVPILERRRSALERSLACRPGWAEGQLRLGLTHLALYRGAARASLADHAADPSTVAELIDPLWLHGLVHAKQADHLLDHEPVRLHLVPAARCLLEARRLAPTLALPHAGLAALDYLLVVGEPTASHASRALRLAGGDGALLARTAQAASQGGDAELAARCWRRSLEVHEAGWREIADAAGAVLSPDEILDLVLPPQAGLALSFADRLYSGPEDREAKALFLHAALARISADRGLEPAERLHLEALAHSGLDDPRRASGLMEEALGLEPMRADWRLKLVEWSTASGDDEGALRQARIGLQFAPDHPDFTKALDEAAAKLARGGPLIPREAIRVAAPPPPGTGKTGR